MLWAAKYSIYNTCFYSYKISHSGSWTCCPNLIKIESLEKEKVAEFSLQNIEMRPVDSDEQNANIFYRRPGRGFVVKNVRDVKNPIFFHRIYLFSAQFLRKIPLANFARLDFFKVDFITDFYKILFFTPSKYSSLFTASLTKTRRKFFFIFSRFFPALTTSTPPPPPGEEVGET